MFILSMASITKHPDTDFWCGTKYNNIQCYGFDGLLSYGEMIDMALKHRCPIIVKVGKGTKKGKEGKWYLKGNGRTKDEIQRQIEKHKGNFKGKKNVTLYFVDLFS